MAKFMQIYVGVKGRPRSSILSPLWAQLWLTPHDDVDYIYVCISIGVSNVCSPFGIL